MKQGFLSTFAAAGLASLFASQAMALDLTVSSIEVNQAVQYGSTLLVGGNTTWVRVKVGTTVATAGVDASLRLTVNGVPQAGPPIFSLNGPITAPVAPNSANINDTINFACAPPVGTIGFIVEVNPNHNPVETNYANNTSTVSKVFACRKVLEIAYVSIHYTPSTPADPPANLIEPGIGDGFLRGIYKPGEWNYHLAAGISLTWSTPINNAGSDTALLNTLLDIRNNQLPAQGQPKPNFVYGWLPGNPFSGNGETIGIPGDVCFGNSDTTRHQRTFAHEMGHALGRSHINQLINTNGVDVENELKDTQNLPQIMPASKNDIMVAGLLTNQAWVWQGTYDAVHNDARMQCGAPAPDAGEEPVLRVSGVITNANRSVALDPVTRILSAMPTANDPNGDTTVIAYDANGNELTRVTVRTDSNRELCVAPVRGRPVLNPTSPLYVMLPETINGQSIQTVRVQDVHTGQITAQRARSANAPQVNITNVSLIENVEGNLDAPAQRVRVQWTASDPDGDVVTSTLLYSPDNGLSWMPLVVNSTAASHEYDPHSVPPNGGHGKLKLITSDGLNITDTEVAALMGDQNDDTDPPATYLISPNNGASFPQRSPIAFHGTSWDVADKMLILNSVKWSSSIDGPIGQGTLMINSNLSVGTHVITLTGTDNSNNSSTKTVSITITPRTIISPDCNNNGVLDSVDITSGTSVDANADGIPDECQSLCAADVTHNNVVDIDDLLSVINGWGACPGACPPSCGPDVTHNCTVDIDDLLSVINAWGPCH
jgi:hypothetical protein